MLIEDIANALADAQGLPKTQAKAAVRLVLDTIAQGLEAGEDVRLAKFGTFRAKVRAARQGTIGTLAYEAPPRVGVRFHAAEALIERLPVPPEAL